MFLVDRNKCTGCGACANNCPQQAISIEKDVAVIDQDRCHQCGSCLSICPSNAIGESVPVHTQVGKGGDAMRGRSWFGWGYRGRGRGNPYPFCRFYPWLPRRWWAYGSAYIPQLTPAYYPIYGPHRWR